MRVIIIQMLNNLILKKVSWNSIVLLLLLLNLLHKDLWQMTAYLIEILREHQMNSKVKSTYLLQLFIHMDPLHFQYLKIKKVILPSGIVEESIFRFAFQ